MSVLLKKERLQKIVDAMSDEEIATLKTIVDSNETPVVYKDINGGNYPLTEGVYFAVVKLDQTKQAQGYVVFNDSECVLIAFNNSQYLKFYKLDPANKTYEQLDNEDATISDLRRVLFASAGEGGAVSSVNEKTGDVVLKADDIDADNHASIQDNLERIDERIDTFVEDNIEGSETIVVDLNEDDSKYEIRLDNDYKTKIDRALVSPLSSPTDNALVGVDETNTQTQNYLGDGLELENSTSPYVINVVGIKEQNDSNVMKLWVGSASEYEALSIKDNMTIYYIVE